MQGAATVETLHDILKKRAASWQSSGWASGDYSVIAEILEWARCPDGSGFVLRAPQFQALEVYWYLRLVEKTPKIPALYQKLIPSKSALVIRHTWIEGGKDPIGWLLIAYWAILPVRTLWQGEERIMSLWRMH